MIFWLQGIDSEVGLAYASILGESYGISQFFYDSDWCSNGCGPVIYSASCDALFPIPNCTVKPGKPCVHCEEQSELSRLCGAE